MKIFANVFCMGSRKNIFRKKCTASEKTDVLLQKKPMYFFRKKLTKPWRKKGRKKFMKNKVSKHNVWISKIHQNSVLEMQIYSISGLKLKIKIQEKDTEK